MTLVAVGAWLWLALVLIMPIAAAERIGRIEAERLRAEIRNPKLASRFPEVTINLPYGTGEPLRLVESGTDWLVVGAGSNVWLVPKSAVVYVGPAGIFKPLVNQRPVALGRTPEPIPARTAPTARADFPLLSRP